MKFELIRKNEKVELVKQIINSLDDLYDDLTYDENEKEVECIKSKIKVREEMLKQLGSL
jgi:uncharacterized membrane-anchored protein YjiN (DUF445 family)